MDRLSRYTEQAGPYSIQIELCEGCNLRCSFCGLQGIRSKEEQGKNYKFMSSATLARTMQGIIAAGWNPRIEFAMHGEPTMHPDYITMIGSARIYAPKLQLMMTSNGGGLLRKPGPLENIQSLFDAGLNILALDDYEGVGIVPKIREKFIATPLDDVLLWEYPTQPEGNPHRRHPSGYRMISLMADISKTSKGTHGQFKVTNHTGCAFPPLKEPLQKRCAEPFREIAVRWDGNISICCNDWRGYYKCGNVNHTWIADIWNGPEFGAAREVLIQGNRKDIGVCSRCDYKTYRNGLLPDKYGKVKLPPPTEQTMADIAKAQEGDSYSEARTTDWGH